MKILLTFENWFLKQIVGYDFDISSYIFWYHANDIRVRFSSIFKQRQILKLYFFLRIFFICKSTSKISNPCSAHLTKQKVREKNICLSNIVKPWYFFLYVSSEYHFTSCAVNLQKFWKLIWYKSCQSFKSKKYDSEKNNLFLNHRSKCFWIRIWREMNIHITHWSDIEVQN